MNIFTLAKFSMIASQFSCLTVPTFPDIEGLGFLDGANTE